MLLSAAAENEVSLVKLICSIYLFYWYKSTNTDATGLAAIGVACQPHAAATEHGTSCNVLLRLRQADA